MKCTVCRGPAVIDLKRHNSNFCPEHFTKYCREQVQRAISDFHMIEPGDAVLVAVSGGKDSLAVWDMLLDLGYRADGLYIGLGIGDYSDTSGHHARAYAADPRRHPDRGRPAGGVRLRHPDRLPRRPALPVFGVRSVQTAPVRQGRARWRVRRAGDRPQPGRRGRRAVRQRAALADRVPRPPTSRAARPERLPPQGQAPGPAVGAGDGGLLHRPGHRLPRRRVPDGRRQQAPGLQGGAEPDRGPLPGVQGRLLLLVPAPGRRAPVRGGVRAGA